MAIAREQHLSVTSHRKHIACFVLHLNDAIGIGRRFDDIVWREPLGLSQPDTQCFRGSSSRCAGFGTIVQPACAYGASASRQRGKSRIGANCDRHKRVGSSDDVIACVYRSHCFDNHCC